MKKIARHFKKQNTCWSKHCLLKHPHKGKITLGEEPSDYTEKIGAGLYNVYISPNKDVQLHSLCNLMDILRREQCGCIAHPVTSCVLKGYVQGAGSSTPTTTCSLCKPLLYYHSEGYEHNVKKWNSKRACKKFKDGLELTNVGLKLIIFVLQRKEGS